MIINTITSRMSQHYHDGGKNACFAYANCSAFEQLSTDHVDVVAGGAVNWWEPAFHALFYVVDGNPIGSISDGGVFVIDHSVSPPRVSYVHATPWPLGLPPEICVEDNWPDGYVLPQPPIGETYVNFLDSVSLRDVLHWWGVERTVTRR